MKAIVIGLVSIGALVALVAVGLFVFVVAHTFGSLSQNVQSDDAATAAKVATFTLPRGYQYASAIDMILLYNVVIEPKARPRRFTIALQGVSSSGGTDEATTEQAIRDGLGRNGSCTQGEPRESVHVTDATGAQVVLNVLHCTRNGKPTRMEYGRVPGKLPIVVLVAAGAPPFFDEGAVRALIHSMH